MTEQLDILGGTHSLDPPQVPPVIFFDEPIVKRIAVLLKPPCAHCVMIADALSRRGGEDLPEPWEAFSGVVMLRAVFRITQQDGSTLDLCAQHAREHQERGNHEGR